MLNKMCKYIDGLCPACKFYHWFDDMQEYRCSIKGCWEGNKFREFTIEGLIEEINNGRKKNTS